MAVTSQSMRLQFEKIWKRNLVDVKIIRFINGTENDNFFWEDDGNDTPIEFNLQLNINGDARGTIARSEEGMTSKGQDKAHCFAKWDMDIKAEDYIEWDGIKYRIEQFDTGALFNGELIFIQFDIIRIKDPITS